MYLGRFSLGLILTASLAVGSTRPAITLALLPYEQHLGGIPVPKGRVEIADITLDSSLDLPQPPALTPGCALYVFYPEVAIKARMRGRVTLQGSLSDGGHVQALWVVAGINPLLDNAALSAFRGASFPLPHIPDGRERRFTAHIMFSLY